MWPRPHDTSSMIMTYCSAGVWSTAGGFRVIVTDPSEARRELTHSPTTVRCPDGSKNVVA